MSGATPPVPPVPLELGGLHGVLIIQGYVILADALSAVLDEEGLRVVGRAYTGAEGLECARALHPAVVLLDLNLPDCEGVELGKEILDGDPRTVIIALSDGDLPESAQQARRRGFSVLSKQIAMTQLIEVLRAAQRGDAITAPRLAFSGHSRPQTPDDFASLLSRQLSPREHQVLELLSAGASSTDIARTMGISVNTVRTHIQNLLAKLQVHSRLEAAALATRHGLVAKSQRETA